MKKLSIILATLMVLAISYSCSEDFFDKQPLGSTSETVFYNEKGIDALLIGTYGIISGGAVWEVSWGASIQNWTYGSVASDDAYKGSEETDQIPVNYIERWEVATTNEYPGNKWKLNLGMGVNRANEVLRIISLTENLDPAWQARKTAEARFLRAFFNFEAWLVFGDYIPLITEDVEDPTQVPNVNPPGAVLAHIIDDLQFAWENLPETQSQVGRPTLYAAKALAARAYLQELDYDSAKPLLDDVIDSDNYELMPNFFDNYRIVHNNNKESIFEIQANVNDINESLNAEMGIGLNWPHGSDINMCCGFHQPSQNLVNAFRVDGDGLPVFDQVNVHLKNDYGVGSEETFVPFNDEVDPRLDWTVGRRGIPYLDWGIMRGRDWIRDQPFGGPYMPALKPFFYKSQRYDLSTTTGWMSGVNANNYRYLRLTHVLLWRAEVAAYDNELELVRDYVNQIRRRAGNEVVMGRVLIDELPPSVYPWGDDTGDEDYLTGGDVDWSQPAANYNIGEYPPFNSQAEAMRAVQWELRLEFATEGMRFFDLRRWDNNLTPNLNSMPMAETLNAFAQSDNRGAMTGATFTDRDKYQPVPQSQIDLQPEVLEQNPNY